MSEPSTEADTASLPDQPPQDFEAAIIQMRRASLDQVIAYDPSCIPKPDTPVRQAVLTARMQQAMAVQGEHRIELATWPEVSIYLSSASVANANWARGSAGRIYMAAFREYANRWLDGEQFERARAAGRFDVALTDVEKRDLGTLRREIKRRRDQLFLEEVYPEIDTAVPKAFWKSGPQAGKIEDVDGGVES